jgi:hypothetical protein
MPPRPHPVLVTLLLLGTLATAATAQVDVVRADGVSLTLGGVVQAGFTYFLGADAPVLESDGTGSAANRGKDREFTLNALRLRASGHLFTDKVRFFTQASLAGEAELLDLRLDFAYVPYTWIHLGRFVPTLTFFGAREPEDLYLIDWPLMDVDPYGRAIHPARQTGLEFAVTLPYLETRIGVFNGENAPLSGDDNTAKDFHVSLTALPPVRGLGARLAYAYGLALNATMSGYIEGEFKEQNDAAQTYVGALWYTPRFGPILVVEAAYRVTNPAPTSEARRTLFTWYAVAGFDLWRWTGLPVQLLARYDSMDPNVDVSRDEYQVITAGFNYSFEGPRARVSLNYLNRRESFRVTGRDGSRQRGFDDDQIKVQVQAAF